MTSPRPRCLRALILAALLGSSPDAWQEHASEHAGHGGGVGHAHEHTLPPIGVGASHLHRAGEWMLSYRFVSMHMDGNRDGTSRLSSGDVLAQGYPVTPTEMDMKMHMTGAMVGLTDGVTFSLVVPFVDLSMEHVTGGGVNFTTEAKGVGDARVGGLFGLWHGEHHQFLLSAGLSLPTGSIDEEDVTPASMGMDTQLPYPMQLGSGTFDLLPGATLLGESGDWSWGGQTIVTLRLGENDNDYTLGDRLDATAWVSRRLDRSFRGSLRLAGATWGNVDGSDPELNPSMVPTADPDLRGGSRVDLLLGAEWNPGGSDVHRLALEIGMPVWQDLDGPQLETDLVLNLGWQALF